MPDQFDSTEPVEKRQWREKDMEAAGEPDRHRLHLRPVWIVLLFLVPCLILTAYYSFYMVPGSTDADSLLPSRSYAFVLLLLNLDLIGLVVLTLLLSRSLVKAYFERRHRLVGSGFRAKLVAAFIGFSLIPTVLLAFVASGLVNKAVDVWFNDQIERVLKDSHEVARMHHEGRMALAINSARAISREIFREDMMVPDQRDLLLAAMARRRTEHNLTGVEVFSSKMETLAKVVDPQVPAMVLDLPVGQLVLQVLNGNQELTSVQEEQTGRLIRAGVPIASNARRGQLDGVVVVDEYVPEPLMTKMEGIARQYTEYRQMKAMKNPIKAGAYLFVSVITVLILFGATWFGFYVARGITVPIERLAAATETIGQGDPNGRIPVKNAYDRMLADARDSLSLEGPMDVKGKFLTIGLSCSHMRNEEGRDLGFVFVFEDLTELIKAQKTAAWQEVAQRIAHEIKNPLTPIQLSAQRLRKKFFDKASDFDKIFDESTGVIVTEVNSLKRMVDEFSKFARMPVPQMARQALHDVVREVVALYRSAHREVEFLVDLDETLPPLNFDREQMNRVFVNLFDNAIQAMSQKGRLWVTTRYDGKRRRAVVSVADEGVGIAPEDQEKLFVPYFSRKRTGTGLGLAIVHRIITDHEGQIRALNNQPKGAVFTFELPA